jgi:nucleotide-binding universal stress UspA family protein
LAGSRLLIAVSTPWASEKLYASVRDLAQRLGASVTVCHVARPTEEDESTDDTRARAEQTLATLATRLTEANIPTHSLLLYGDDVAKAILNAAQDQRASLIVLGLSGKSALARFLSGDIPQQIIRQSKIPVLAYPPDWSGVI